MISSEVIKKVDMSGKEYFGSWTFEKPLLISNDTDSKVKLIQKVIYKMINYFVKNYEDLISLDEQTKRVLGYFRGKEYKSGSYRTDFVIDQNHQFRLIEITCRFAFNGIWMSGLLDSMAKEYSIKNNINHQSYFQILVDYLFEKFEGKEIIILSHKGKGEESRYYQELLSDAGFTIKKIFLEETEEELKSIKNKLFITEFNQEDYYGLSDFALEQLAKAEVINDLRTVFLVHDKRFFTILDDTEIRKKVLSKEEIELLDTFYIPTYSHGKDEDKWTLAKENKNDWILKHKHLGKSAKVFAGLVTDEKEWQFLFENQEVKDMILQPFIKQPKFKGRIGDKQYEDYVVGTMLFFDDNYFGLGLFRSSSHPVTNVVDDRKVMHLNISDEENFEDYIVL